MLKKSEFLLKLGSAVKKYEHAAGFTAHRNEDELKASVIRIVREAFHLDHEHYGSLAEDFYLFLDSEVVPEMKRISESRLSGRQHSLISDINFLIAIETAWEKYEYLAREADQLAEHYKVYKE